MSVKYITKNSYPSVKEFFKAIVDAANFWSETSDTAATVGGVTLSYDSEFFYLSGYGSARILAMISYGSAATNTKIAVSDKGLLICGGGKAGGTPSYCLAIGADRGGIWGGMIVPFEGNGAPTYVAPDWSSATEITLTPGKSSVITQFIPAVPVGGNFVFDTIFRLVMSPNPDYIGKVDIDGTSFIQFGALAMSYTE